MVNKVKEKSDSVESVQVKQKNESEKIWDEIKDIQLNMFSLPDQTVEKYCNPLQIEQNRLYVTLKASSAAVALEEAITKKFDIISAGKFLIISRK